MPLSSDIPLNELTVGSIGIVRIEMPRFSASSLASEIEWSDEYLLGIKTPNTFDLPSASTAIVATRAESIPPESPITTLFSWFLNT